jgi:histone chaperone ASF1
MSVVSLLGVKVLDNPAAFTDPYKFEITFECLEQLRHGKNCEASRLESDTDTASDLEWKLTYVGSATSYVHFMR